MDYPKMVEVECHACYTIFSEKVWRSDYLYRNSGCCKCGSPNTLWVESPASEASRGEMDRELEKFRTLHRKVRK